MSLSVLELEAELAELRAALVNITGNLNTDTGVQRQNYGLSLRRYTVENTTARPGNVGYGVSITDETGAAFILFRGHKPTVVNGISAGMQRLIDRGLISVEPV